MEVFLNAWYKLNMVPSSSGQGRRPFKAATPVRIWLGSLMPLRCMMHTLHWAERPQFKSAKGHYGEVAERAKAAVLKTAVSKAPWVRIPPSPLCTGSSNDRAGALRCQVGGSNPLQYSMGS